MKKRRLQHIFLPFGMIGISLLIIYFVFILVGKLEPAAVVQAPLATSTGATSNHLPAVNDTPAVVVVATSAPISTPDAIPVPSPISPAATSTVIAKSQASSSSIIISVPFTSQAPLGQWSDERQQDGCEEASVAMAMAWVKGESNITKSEWLTRILDLADFEQEKYGEHRDVALDDVVAWMFNDYFNYEKVAIKPVASYTDIVKEVEQGHVVLIPANGQSLKNPYFSPPGPEEHMLLIKGYDYKAKEFITNDPGTRRGEGYRYSQSVIFNAIRPYDTGYKLPFPKILAKEMIVVSK